MMPNSVLNLSFSKTRLLFFVLFWLKIYLFPVP